jgi:hypothetical protein
VGVALNVGGREIAGAEFDAAVRRYNAKTSAAGRKELIEKCNAILNVDERIRSSLEGLKGTYERTLKVIETLKPTSPSWEQVGTGVTSRLAAAAKDAAGAVEQKKVDAATCLKVK